MSHGSICKFGKFASLQVCNFCKFIKFSNFQIFHGSQLLSDFQTFLFDCISVAWARLQTGVITPRSQQWSVQLYLGQPCFFYHKFYCTIISARYRTPNFSSICSTFFIIVVKTLKKDHSETLEINKVSKLNMKSCQVFFVQSKYLFAVFTRRCLETNKTN